MDRPFVFINVAMTADGKIDTFQRKGAAISSPILRWAGRLVPLNWGARLRKTRLRTGAILTLQPWSRRQWEGFRSTAHAPPTALSFVHKASALVRLVSETRMI